MTQHCTITGTMLVPVHYIICTLKIVFFPEITVFVVVKINSFQCQCQCQGKALRLGCFFPIKDGEIFGIGVILFIWNGEHSTAQGVMITEAFLRAMVAPETRTFRCPPRHRAM